MHGIVVSYMEQGNKSREFWMISAALAASGVVLAFALKDAPEQTVRQVNPLCAADLDCDGLSNDIDTNPSVFGGPDADFDGIPNRNDDQPYTVTIEQK